MMFILDGWLKVERADNTNLRKQKQRLEVCMRISCNSHTKEQNVMAHCLALLGHVWMLVMVEEYSRLFFFFEERIFKTLGNP